MRRVDELVMTRCHGPGHQYICLKLRRKINRFNFEDGYQGVTTKRCLLSTGGQNDDFRPYDLYLWGEGHVVPKCRARGRGGVARSRPMNTAVLMEPK